MKMSITILFLSLCLFPQIGFAQWEEAFPVENLESYFVQDKLVIVVSVDAIEATSEVLKGLGGKAMSGTALGDVSALSDAEIVKLAAAQPVQKVVIVRLAGEGETATAITTIYNKDGSAAGGFTASRETPLAKSDSQSGVSQEEIKSVKAAAPKVSDQKDAKKQFLANYVGFVDWTGINQYGGVVVTWSVPFKGQDRNPLEGADFYDEVGRSDLADDYRSSQTTKTIVVIGTIVVAVAGTGLMLASILDVDEASNSGLEVYESPSLGTGFYVGAGMSLIGAMAIPLALGWNPHPVKPEEARRLARLHNEKLAEDLGISIDALERSQIHAPAIPTEMCVGISPNLGGGSVNVGFTF